MIRPTRDQLIHAAGLLEELAHRYDSRNNPNGWPDLYRLLDLLVWLDVDLDLAKQSAVFGPGGERSPEGGGTIGAQTIGRYGLNRPVESRFAYPAAITRDHKGIVLNDPLVRDLTRLRGAWDSKLGRLVNGCQDEALHVASWPNHIEHKR